jgi:hypothetical protein
MEPSITGDDPQGAAGAMWRTLEPEWVLRHILQPPPRRWSYLAQLRKDAGGTAVRVIWAAAAGLFLLGYALRSNGLTSLALAAAWLGASLLVYWLACFLRCVRSMRNDRVGMGVLRSLRLDAVYPDTAHASVLLPDGRAIEVGVMTDLVLDFVHRDGQCEVLFRAGTASPTDGGLIFAARETRLPSAQAARGPASGGVSDAPLGGLPGLTPSQPERGVTSRGAQAGQ